MQTTCAPSRASTSAIAAPIPRDAPVTAATLPSSGRAQRLGRVRHGGADADHLAGHVGGAAGEQEAQRRLEVGARVPRGRAGPSRRGGPPCAAERTKPSSARWATPSPLPSTISRPHGASERIAGWKKSYAARRSPAALDPRRVEDERAVGLRVVRLRDAARRQHAPDRRRPAARRHRPAPARRRTPGPRCSGVGCGRPSRRTMKRPGGESANCWYRSAMSAGLPD